MYPRHFAVSAAPIGAEVIAIAQTGHHIGRLGFTQKAHTYFAAQRTHSIARQIADGGVVRVSDEIGISTSTLERCQELSIDPELALRVGIDALKFIATSDNSRPLYSYTRAQPKWGERTVNKRLHVARVAGHLSLNQYDVGPKAATWLSWTTR